MENAAEEEIKDGGTDMISNLPEGILYNILFFLSKNDAARTCVLSKPWRSLWTNRLKLSYDERSSLFNGPHRTRLFTSHVTNALALAHNHRIEELHLIVTYSSESIFHFEKWIPMLAATRLVKDLFISIVPEPELISKTQEFPYTELPDLPSSVFKSDCLKSLHVHRCNLRLQNIPTTKAHFSRLNSLRLYNVKFTDKRIFKKIMRSCPHITTMWFQECQGLKTVTLVHHKYLEHFTFINHRTHDRNECRIRIHIPTLQTIDILGSRTLFLGGHKFSNLKILLLEWIKFSRFSFDWSSSYEFPLLETLVIISCQWPWFDQMLNINAPKLVFFQCAGRSIPSITFATPMSRKCRSEIMFGCCVYPKTWFVKLSRFLHALGQSMILLGICQLDPNIHNVIYEPGVHNIIIGGNKHVEVELLQLEMGHLPSFPRVLNSMLSICRPRKIGHDHSYVLGGEPQKELTQFLWNFLTIKTSDTWKEDLEQVWIESFDDDADTKQWEPVALLPENEKRHIRFQLEWTEDANSEEEEEEEEESNSSKRRKLE